MTDLAGVAFLRRLAVGALLLVTGFVAPPDAPNAPDAPDASSAPDAARAPQSPERFAVVVHPSTPAGDVTLAQLRRVFRGEQQFWSGGARVVVLLQAEGTGERAAVLRRVYQMDEGAYKRFWIAKTFRDEVTSGPKIVSTSALALKLAARIPGAVAIVPLGAVDETVRVLKVDGRLPDEAGYPLTEPTP